MSIKDFKGENEKTILNEVEAKFLTENHLALWNERDANKRPEIMEKIYSADIEMIDRHFIAAGHKQVEGFVIGLHEKNLEGRFLPTRPIEFHHNIIRMFWQSGPPSKPDAATGMDLFVIENGKVEKLYVFVDTV
jgi:hypothetical protein